MRAIAIDDFGAPPALHDLPVPQPVAGEVLVRVQASSVNGFDLSVAKGYLKDAMEHRFPVVLGKDFAGTVEATGPGVETLQVGDAVFGVVMKPELGDGAFGEYVTAPAAFIAKVPAGLEVARAGALGLAGTAALDAVDAIAPNSGETVLVSGATGGVGAFAVQLLRARGIDVIATASSDEKGAFVRGLGAGNVVDYRGDLAAVVTAIRPDGPDAALHLAGDGAALATLCAPGGRVASTLGLSPDSVADAEVQIIPVMAAPTTETLDRLAAAVLDGTLAVPIARTYALADVPQAFADFAGGTLGKLAVTVD